MYKKCPNQHFAAEPPEIRSRQTQVSLEEHPCFPIAMWCKTFPRLLFTGAAVLLDVCMLNFFIHGAQSSFADLVKVPVADVAKQLANTSRSGISQRIITDVKYEGHRMCEIFQDSKNTVLDCNCLGSKDLIDTVLKVVPGDMVTEITQDEMQYFLDLCDGRVEDDTQGPLKSILDFIGTTLRSLVIFPGTKWCGAGDIAKNYDDLGRERETDKCCRDHDHSTDNLSPLETKHGITNFMIFTMTNCPDDCKFYNCLLNVSSVASGSVGTVYFNVLGTKCYAYGYPQKCVRYNVIRVPGLSNLCKEYKANTSKKEQWRTYAQQSFSESVKTRSCSQYNQTA